MSQCSAFLLHIQSSVVASRYTCATDQRHSGIAASPCVRQLVHPHSSGCSSAGHLVHVHDRAVQKAAVDRAVHVESRMGRVTTCVGTNRRRAVVDARSSPAVADRADPGGPDAQCGSSKTGWHCVGPHLDVASLRLADVRIDRCDLRNRARSRSSYRRLFSPLINLPHPGTGVSCADDSARRMPGVPVTIFYFFFFGHRVLRPLRANSNPSAPRPCPYSPLRPAAASPRPTEARHRSCGPRSAPRLRIHRSGGPQPPVSRRRGYAYNRHGT